MYPTPDGTMPARNHAGQLAALQTKVHKPSWDGRPKRDQIRHETPHRGAVSDHDGALGCLRSFHSGRSQLESPRVSSPRTLEPSPLDCGTSASEVFLSSRGHAVVGRGASRSPCRERRSLRSYCRHFTRSRRFRINGRSRPFAAPSRRIVDGPNDGLLLGRLRVAANARVFDVWTPRLAGPGLPSSDRLAPGLGPAGVTPRDPDLGLSTAEVIVSFSPVVIPSDLAGHSG